MTLQEPPYDDRHLRPVPDDEPETGGRATPPADIPAEKALLSALLQAPSHVPQLATELTGPDFYQPRNETIWNALQQATDDGTTDRTIIAERVAQAITHNGNARHAPYLLELATGDGDPLYLPAYTQTIRDHARLRAVATAARAVLGQAEKGDLDKVDQTLAELVDVTAEAALRYGPSTNTTRTGFRDLSWLTDGTWPVIDPPTWGKRTDGHALFYAGRVNGIFGDPESAKTWLAKLCCLEAMNAGQAAAMIDVDHNGQELTVSQLLLLGATPKQLSDPKTFRYYEPDDAGELHAAVTDIVAWAPAVVVLDSIGEMLPMLGVKSVDNDEITGALRTIASAPAKAGSCVITIDHLPKGTDARASGYAIGGTAKKRALDGSYIYAKTILAPAPGQFGKVALRIEKDRPGELRKSCKGSRNIGDFTLDSRTENTTKALIVSALNDGGEFVPTHFMELASRIIEERDGVTGREICTDIRGKDETIRLAIQLLIRGGYVTTTPGRGVTIHHHHVKPYREDAEDDEPLF